MTKDALTPKQRRFVDEYLIDWNGTRAAKAAGYSAGTAHSIANENLSKPEIQAALASRRRDVELRTEFSQDDVRRELIAMVEADPRDLIDIRRVPCRCCYGAGHLPQETPPERHARFSAYEMATTLRRLEAKGAKDLALIPAFDELGGLGYDERKPINDDCPVCMGRGEERVTAKDMSSLPPRALKLLKGVKVTNTGIEILMHDKGRALELLARHLAMLTDKTINLNLNIDAELPSDPTAAAQAYARLMG